MTVSNHPMIVTALAYFGWLGTQGGGNASFRAPITWRSDVVMDSTKFQVSCSDTLGHGPILCELVG